MTHPDVSIRSLEADDWRLLEDVAADVFDHPIQAKLAKEFLADPRHHIVVAVDDGTIVGFVSGVHYVHPDKAAELFINEVGVSAAHRREGIGAKLLDAILRKGRALGCREAWVATEPDNRAARALYTSVGGEEDPTPFVLYSFSLEPAP